MATVRRLLLLPAALLAAPHAARAQEVSALARPEPDIPILYLAPPPAAAPNPEDRPMAMVTLLVAPPPSPNAAALPPPARALIEKAIESGNADSFKAVAQLAREMYPTGSAQIDALSAENEAQLAEKKAEAARERADALAAASFLDNWKGEAEIGGSYATGASNTIAVYGGLKLNKEGLRWRHALTARMDLQKTDQETSAERATALYQPQYKFGDRLYVFGIAQFEHDLLLGYQERYTIGPGLGYTLFTGPRLRVDIEGGPAGRRTVYYRASPRWTGAGRGSLNLTWKPSAAITLTSTNAVFFESNGNSNLQSLTALDTRLFGPLKARFSYNVTFEQDTPDVARTVNTISRASLVYSF